MVWIVGFNGFSQVSMILIVSFKHIFLFCVWIAPSHPTGTLSGWALLITGLLGNVFIFSSLMQVFEWFG